MIVHFVKINVQSLSCAVAITQNSEDTCTIDHIINKILCPTIQLGHGDTVKKTRPVQIAALADKSVVSVACGQYHSLALDDDHR